MENPHRRQARVCRPISALIVTLLCIAFGSGCDRIAASSNWQVVRLGEPIGRRLVARESREVLRTAARLDVAAMLPAGCMLDIGYASTREDIRRVFRVKAFTEAGAEVELLETPVDMKVDWVDSRYRVPRGGFSSLRLEIDGDHADAYWSRPIAYCPTQGKRSDVKNVVLVSLDTLRADRLGVYANPHELTPAMDRIGAEGTLFEYAYAPYPNTLSSHATLFTGFYPTQHGIVAGRMQKIPADAKTLARAFFDAGHYTIAFTENGYVASGWGFAAGFDRYHNGTEPAVKGQFSGNAEDTFSLALGWLETRTDVPFFMFLHTYEVHKPYDPAPERIRKLWKQRGIHYSGRFEARFGPLWGFAYNRGDLLLTRSNRRQIELLYDAEVIDLDAQVGRLERALDRHGLAGDTLVVLMSDHGEEFDEHGFLGHGDTLHQEALRIPMILRLPGRVPAGRRIASPVGLIDLGPTIAELAGIERPFDDAPAQSLVTDIMGRANGLTRPVFSELEDTLGACVTRRAGKFKTCPYRGVAVREGRFAFIHRAVTGEVQLFDYATDRAEQRNVADRFTKRTAYFESLVSEFRANVEATKTLVVPHRVDSETQQNLKALGYVD